MEEPYFGEKLITSSSFASLNDKQQQQQKIIHEIHKNDETGILSDIIHDETNNIVTFQRLELTWNEIFLPITILTFILFGLVIITIILINWLSKKLKKSIKTKLNEQEFYYKKLKDIRMDSATPPQTPDLLPILVPVPVPVTITRSHQIFTTATSSSTTGTKSKIPKQKEWILHEPTQPKLQNDSIQPKLDYFNYNFINKSDNKENQTNSDELLNSPKKLINSPLMPSAGYKHGNYFKFPEVDLLTPTQKICAKNERRERLKSLSLDSETVFEENFEIKNFEKSNFENSNFEKSFENSNFDKKISKNKNHLTINLHIKDDSICDDYNYNKTPTPKTPTFQQSRQKAISLDSEQKFFSNFLIQKIVSVSVPTTPKRQQINKKSIQKFFNTKTKQTESRNLLQRKLGSFDENKLFPEIDTNLQNSKLSVSNNNLKTLPEIMTLSDFNTIDKPIIKNRSILQRRGSNHSLTLNLDDSITNLTKNLSLSNYSLTNKKTTNLLQRRGSNTSLTLNIETSSKNLNHFNSHCSLNQLQEKTVKKGLLERRNSNASLTLNIENHCLSTKYGSIDNLKKQQQQQTIEKSINDEAVGGSVRNITTKPLSPQSTTEDFKIYLANIQFLQNATNLLTEQHLMKLSYVFQNSYIKTKNFSKISNQLKLSKDEFKQLIRSIHQEFWDLPTNYQEKPLVFGSQSKNRYKTILPNEHSRVILKNEDGCLIEPYVNANFIKGPDYLNNSYIATQGPMPNTIYEFWLMIYQNVKKSNNGYQKIAMLTDFIENNRQKCAIYFPTEEGSKLAFLNNYNQNDTNLIDYKTDEILKEIYENDFDESEIISKNFNYFLIKNLEVTNKNGYKISKLMICYNNKITSQSTYKFIVYHYWFPDWPDHRSPEDIDVLLDMSLDLLENKTEMDLQHPIPIIHCSAGIGRTGCLAAILNGLRQMQLNHSTSVDILGIVCNLRLQRGGMVQNSEQYELIHRAICLYQQRLIECQENFN